MTKEEAKEIIESECYVFNPLNFDRTTRINTALDVAVEALEQEPCEDVMAIHTQGLDEGIRCAMCTNSMKSNRGCDGGCVVNEGMYKEVMNTIRNHIVPSVTPTRKKGKWVGICQIGFGEFAECEVELIDGFVTDNCHCSECGEELEKGERGIYCPNCGCFMSEGEITHEY